MNVPSSALVSLVRAVLTKGPVLTKALGSSDFRRALIVPPAVPGSLGDAAMLSATTRYLRTHGVRQIDLAFGKDWPLDERIDDRIRAERFFYRGSSLQQALVIAQLPKYSEVYFVGADVIDGAYNPLSVRGRLSLLAEAARLGRKATLLGASYNEQPEATTRDALRGLPPEVVLCARDPNSRKRMEQALERPIRQVADLGFLLRALPSDAVAADAIDWISRRRAAGDQVVGLNANYLHAEKDARIPGALSAVLRELLGKDLSVVLVPHDTRTERSDETLLAEAAAALPAEERARTYMLAPRSPGAIKAVLAELDLVITGRMHAAILAMGSSTPAFCFAYQDKFEGLFSFFDFEHEDMLSSPKELAEDPLRVAARAMEALARSATLRHKIGAHLPRVRELAEQNFA